MTCQKWKIGWLNRRPRYVREKQNETLESEIKPDRPSKLGKRHFHRCDKCHRMYSHQHTHTGFHNQTQFQCPYLGCEWYFGRGRGTQKENRTRLRWEDLWTLIKVSALNYQWLPQSYQTKVILSDHGSQFISAPWRMLLAQNNIAHTLSSIRHTKTGSPEEELLKQPPCLPSVRT